MSWSSDIHVSVFLKQCMVGFCPSLTTRIYFLALRMCFSKLDADGRIMFISRWCSPAEYLAMLYTSKLWGCTVFFRNSALFALSRKHAPEFNAEVAMHDWYVVWMQCRDVCRRRNWPVALWRDACVFMVRGCPFVAHAPFFEAFDAMLQSRSPSLSVSSVLATTLRIHPYELHALLLLCSGSFAFIGSMEAPDSDSEDEDGN